MWFVVEECEGVIGRAAARSGHSARARSTRRAFPAFPARSAFTGPLVLLQTGRPRRDHREEAACPCPWCQVFCRLGNLRSDGHGERRSGLRLHVGCAAGCFGPVNKGGSAGTMIAAPAMSHASMECVTHDGAPKPAPVRAPVFSSTLGLQASVHIVFWRATGFSRNADFWNCPLMCVSILI